MYYWLAGWLAGLIDMMKYQTPPSARATMNEKETPTLWWSPADSRSCFGPMIVVVQNLRKGNHRPSRQGQKVRHHF